MNADFRQSGTYKIRAFSSDGLLLGLSLVLQLAMGLFLGHAYDTSINMATGVLVGTGQNPYIAQDLSLIFHNSSFQGLTSIGYPPPWPLVLGLMESLSYKIIPNFLFYNLAIKLPIIAANIALAYLVCTIILKLRGDPKVARLAWIFLLFNPFFLYASSAWGQFDSLVALLSLWSLVLLVDGKWTLSAILLALAISFKPTALPLIATVFLFLRPRSAAQVWRFFAVLFVSGLLMLVGPFIAFGWDPATVLQNWNFHFTVGGGLSFLSMLELIRGSTRLPGAWWLVGLLWVPAVTITAIVLRNRAVGLLDLLKTSAILILVFFLFSSWVSEPNILLVLPLILVLTSIGALDDRALLAVWLLPLIFSFFNTAAFQLLFPSLPVLMADWLRGVSSMGSVWWVARTFIVLLWLLAGTRIVLALHKMPVHEIAVA